MQLPLTSRFKASVSLLGSEKYTSYIYTIGIFFSMPKTKNVNFTVSKLQHTFQIKESARFLCKRNTKKCTDSFMLLLRYTKILNYNKIMFKFKR